MADAPALQKHPFPPLFGARSKVLILGSFPSVKSREALFFYGHPQNRFWRVMAALTDSEVPKTQAEKEALILSNGFALWDVIGQCTLIGSSDSSIRDVVPNDLSLLSEAPIERIFCNGRTAYQCYRRYAEPLTGRPAELLPSTSPANAAWSLERLVEAWQVLLDETKR